LGFAALCDAVARCPADGEGYLRGEDAGIGGFFRCCQQADACQRGHRRRVGSGECRAGQLEHLADAARARVGQRCPHGDAAAFDGDAEVSVAYRRVEAAQDIMRLSEREQGGVEDCDDVADRELRRGHRRKNGRMRARPAAGRVRRRAGSR